MKQARFLPLVFGLLSAVACSSGHGSSSLTPSGQTSSQNSTQVAFSITIPHGTIAAAQRALQYISAGTQSATVAVSQGTGTPVTAQVPCNLTTFNCSGNVTAPIGSDTFVATLWSGASGGGNALSIGTATQTIAAGTNAVNVTFEPVVASVSVNASPQVLSSNSAGLTSQVTVTEFDASGAQIIGGNGETFVNPAGQPLTLTLTSSSANLSLSQTALLGPIQTGPVTVTATLNSPLTNIEYPILSVTAPGISTSAITGTQVGVPYTSGTLIPDWAENAIDIFTGGQDVIYAAVDCVQTACTPVTGYSLNGNIAANGSTGYIGQAGLLAEGSDGNIWIYDPYAQAFAYTSPALSGAVTYPANGSVINQAAVDCSIGGAYSCVTQLTLGPDGNLWFNLREDSQIGYITPQGNVNLINVDVPDGVDAFAFKGNTILMMGSPANAFVFYSMPISGGAVSSIGTIPPNSSLFGSTYALGYSPIDQGIYADPNIEITNTLTPPGAISSISTVSGQTASEICSDDVGAGSATPYLGNGHQLVPLPDGTLAYADTNFAGTFTVVRIAPGAGCLGVPGSFSNGSIPFLAVLSFAYGTRSNGNLFVLASTYDPDLCPPECNRPQHSIGLGIERGTETTLDKRRRSSTPMHN